MNPKTKNLHVATHTGGPWGIEMTEDTMWIGPMRIEGQKVFEIVCRCDGGSNDGYAPMAHATKMANAILIASAPQLLAAVEWLAKSMEEYQQAVLHGEEITLGMAMRADGGLDKARQAIAKHRFPKDC